MAGEYGWLLGTLAFWERKHFFLDYVMSQTLGIKIKRRNSLHHKKKPLQVVEKKRVGEREDGWTSALPLASSLECRGHSRAQMWQGYSFEKQECQPQWVFSDSHSENS